MTLEGRRPRRPDYSAHNARKSHLICNTLCVDLSGGDAWFRWAVLSWSSDRTWTAFNTLDDRWNPSVEWKGLTGADGIYLLEGPKNRNTRWGDQPQSAGAFRPAPPAVKDGVSLLEAEFVDGSVRRY
jgi:hypothetical protein